MEIKKYLNEEGQLVRWPKKQAEKELVITYLASKFEVGMVYHELEVNEILKQWHTFTDWSLLRRELVERDYMRRNTDGTEYKLLVNS